MQSYKKLTTIFKRYSQLNYLQRILMWDSTVMMPRGGAAYRAKSMATLHRTIQKLLTNKKIKDYLTQAKMETNLSDWDKTNLNLMEKQYLRTECIPLSLAEKATQASVACEQAWMKLRAKNDWATFMPYLEQTFLYNKEIAKRRGDALQLHSYDALLDEYATGFNQKSIDAIFASLKNTLPPLLKEIIAKQKNETVTVPSGPFAEHKQKELGLMVMKALGFDFHHGRLDISHHPFCSGGPTDVRMTTRYSESEFLSSLFAICHETGHAMYEQGMPKKWINQLVGQVHTMAMHESQSLLIEMDVCRSSMFYDYILAKVKKEFGDQPAFTAQNLYKLATRVQPGLIRVDADEVTYPFHIILRYEIEKQLFNDELSIKDLPARWHELMTQYLDLATTGKDKDGVMQDVHWPSGAFGYFPAYTLGRLIAAQFFTTYKKQHPDFSDHFNMGNFEPLRNWLTENIYSYASLLPTQTLLQKITGKPLDANYFIDHLKARYLS